jgi:UDP-N-acetyl-D-mannosaminuronic acid transferase (WecB/TagA/CpsF family)
VQIAGAGIAERQIFIDTPMDALTREETVSLAVNAVRTGNKVTHYALNVAKLVRMRSNATLHDIVCAADIVGVDGMGRLGRQAYRHPCTGAGGGHRSDALAAGTMRAAWVSAVGTHHA